MKSRLLIFLLISKFGFCQNSKLEILVDERMELITTVQYLSDYSLLTKSNIKYKKDIDKYFKEYKNHPVIKLNKIIQNDFFSGSCVPWFLYQFSFPSFKSISKFAEDENQIENYNQHKDTLELFKKELKDFYRKSNFKKFFNQNKKLYDSISKPVKEYINNYNIISILENHYGEKKKKYKLVLCPLMHDGGFAAEVNKKNGQEIIAFIGPKYNSEIIPKFDTKDILQQYVIHEFSHSFCNPIIYKNFQKLKEYECLENKIVRQMEKQGYGDDWQTCLYEHLVRANEIVLTKQLFGTDETYKLYDKYYNKRSWIYLKGLVPIIEEYIINREKYKTQFDLIDKFLIYFGNEKLRNCSQEKLQSN